MSSRYDLQKREQERKRLLENYRSYVDQNNPPLMSDLKNHMKPLLGRGYANLPELLNIVNAKIFPMRVVNNDDGLISYNASTDILRGLKLMDTRDNEETLRNSSTKNGMPTYLTNVKSLKDRKYIVSDGAKHWIPDSETKNALGLEANSFVQLSDEELDKLKDGENIQSVKSPSTRLVRTKKHHNDVFMVFKWPETHRRHVPDMETLTAMRRRQSQTDTIEEKEMSDIPKKDALNPVSKWNPKIIKSKPVSNPQNIHNYFPPVANTGSHVRKIKQKNTRKLYDEHPFLTVLSILGSLASIVGLLLYFF